MAWWVDRVLPGVVSSGVVLASVWLSHRRLRHHITRVTQAQNAHIDQLTAAQTAALSGKPEGT
jgi:hypothetical protein